MSLGTISEELRQLRAECEDLAESLRPHCPFQWLVNPGNAGDGLIEAGTRELFRQYGLEHSVVTRDTVIPTVPLVYGGGGAWCRAFGIGPQIVREVAAIVPLVIVLPSTFEACEVARLGDLPHVVLCGRDYDSAAIALGHRRSREGLSELPTFTPDLAFMCPIPEGLPPGVGVLAAFRRDSIGTPFLPTLESIGATSYTDPSAEGSHASGDQLLRHVAKYDIIHTDRTHVAIAGGMLGRDTYLYPNGMGYAKNTDLYAASLARFEHCIMKVRQ